MKLDDKRRAFIGMGIVSVILGVLQICHGSGPPGGKWRLVLAPIYENFGSSGLGLSSIGIGIVLVYLGLSGKTG